MAYEIGKEEASKGARLLALASKDGQAIRTAPGRLSDALRELGMLKQSGNRSGYDRLLETTLQELRAAYRKSE